jgi:Putative peptidoglycan binding domain
MAWRLTESLVVLRAQIDARAPHRSRASDGTIGDAAHRHRPSRHNPNAAGVVCAIDITDDPVNGCPIHRIAEQVSFNPHPDPAYIISDRRIAGRSTAWKWHRYAGPNPHSHRAHYGVGTGPDGEPGPHYDDKQPWRGVDSSNANVSVPRTPRRGMRGEDVRGLRRLLIGAGHLAGGADGIFGPKTQAAVRMLQAQLGLSADGVGGARDSRCDRSPVGLVWPERGALTRSGGRVGRSGAAEGRRASVVMVALAQAVAPTVRIKPESPPTRSSSQSTRTDRCPNNAQCGVLFHEQRGYHALNLPVTASRQTADK